VSFRDDYFAGLRVFLLDVLKRGFVDVVVLGGFVVWAFGGAGVFVVGLLVGFLLFGGFVSGPNLFKGFARPLTLANLLFAFVHLCSDQDISGFFVLGFLRCSIYFFSLFCAALLPGEIGTTVSDNAPTWPLVNFSVSGFPLWGSFFGGFVAEW